MPRGGQLTIDVQDVEIDEPHARQPGVAAPPRPYVMLAVSDPGDERAALAERLPTLRPAARVVYISGHTNDVVVRHGMVDERRRFSGKPFTAMELTRKVRDVLDAEA